MPKVVHASIKERFRLNHPHSGKETYHLVLDLSGLGISYEVGDCLAIYPQNVPELVDELLSIMEASGEEEVLIKGEPLPLRRFLEAANLARVTKALFQKTCPSSHSSLLDPAKKEALKAHLEKTHVAEHLRLSQEKVLSCQEMCDYLAPMTPRFYSIASSMRVVGEEAHLTIGVARNPPHLPTLFGTCSHYLCHRAPLHTPAITLYHHPSRTFRPPEESYSKPIIMIGPGTGIAPFRGFLQERLARSPQENNWLFFGERRRAYDFYYEDEFKAYEKQGALRQSVAFSRDQEKKEYVQHKLLEHQKDVWEWLEKGAYLFVCGDAEKMAKDVDAALLQIFQKEGKRSLDDAKALMKQLRQERRYLRDVY